MTANAKSMAALQFYIKLGKIKRWTLSTALEERDVKGVALKTHEGLRPSTLRAAFTSKAGVEKARAKLLSVL